MPFSDYLFDALEIWFSLFEDKKLETFKNAQMQFVRIAHTLAKQEELAELGIYMH